MKLSVSLSQSPPITSVYSAKQVLENEAKVAQSQNIALYELMQSAGAAAFEQLIQHWPKAKQILLLCGRGNNGGDGFVVAKLAHQANIDVEIIITCSIKQLKGDALRAYKDMLSAGVVAVHEQVNEADIHSNVEKVMDYRGDVIIDALFGIGFSGALDKHFQQLVKSVNAQDIAVLSIDVPSGLCATTGTVKGDEISEQAIIATVTVTFIVFKQGLLTGVAANFVGKLMLAPLAMQKVFTQSIHTDIHYAQFKRALQLPKRLAASHKGSSGTLLAVGGGEGMPGAIRLASEAALRCGVGLVSVSCHSLNQGALINGRPELMLAPTTSSLLVNSRQLLMAKAYLIGPGLGQSAEAKKLLALVCQQAMEAKKTLVVDADALTLLSQSETYYDNWVLTPHPKEAASLLHIDIASVEADRFTAVRSIAKKYGGICLLKGAGTLISDGERVVVNNSGNAGMATGGMGDVLTGVIAAIMMQSDNNFNATCLAAYIHGTSADIIAQQNGQRGLLASDLFLPLQQLLNAKC
jgi:NAD(P)H-hydrate epimerase